jgi:hypothetical protein
MAERNLVRSRTKTVITLETWRRTTVRIARNTVPTDELAVHESQRDPYRIVEPADSKISILLEPGGQEEHE